MHKLISQDSWFCERRMIITWRILSFTSLRQCSQLFTQLHTKELIHYSLMTGDKAIGPPRLFYLSEYTFKKSRILSSNVHRNFIVLKKQLCLHTKGHICETLVTYFLEKCKCRHKYWHLITRRKLLYFYDQHLLLNLWLIRLTYNDGPFTLKHVFGNNVFFLPIKKNRVYLICWSVWTWVLSIHKIKSRKYTFRREEICIFSDDYYTL